MPIYEYKCPKGHVFELFQGMTEPPPDGCTVCGESPLEKVLYPVAVHFKGSGFYTTDYGRGARKREPEKTSSSDGAGGDSEKKVDKKPAEAKESG